LSTYDLDQDFYILYFFFNSSDLVEHEHSNRVMIVMDALKGSNIMSLHLFILTKKIVCILCIAIVMLLRHFSLEA